MRPAEIERDVVSPQVLLPQRLSGRRSGRMSCVPWC